MFIARLHDERLWDPGVTPYELAGVIVGPKGKALTAETILNYSSEANNTRAIIASKENLHLVVFGETLKQIEFARGLREGVKATLDRWVDPETGSYSVGTPMDLKMACEGAKAALETMSNELDRLARVTGLIQSGTTINLAIEVAGVKMRPAGPELAQYAKTLTEALLASGNVELISVVRSEMRRLGPGGGQ